MSVLPLDGETDPVRRNIISAINRMLAGTLHRSQGWLNVSPFAIEANINRWHLTHQHLDLKTAVPDSGRTSREQTGSGRPVSR